MSCDPRMYIGTIDAAGRHHVRDDSEKFSRLKHLQALRARFCAHDLIAAALERGRDVCHYGRLVFDKKDGQRFRLHGRQTHRCRTPAATPLKADSERPGKRTMNVAPWVPELLWHRISPPCSRTMP